MNDVEARDFIPGLGDSFTLRELTRAFRRQSFVVHPDHGGVDEEFVLLQQAYDVLKSKASHELGKEVYEIQTVDGTPLTELGKGLPITVSAKECEFCEGRGYKVFYNYTQNVTCPDCNGEGTFWLPCKKCQGTGDYKHPRSGEVIGKCNLCGGNGRFYPKYHPNNNRQNRVWTLFNWTLPPKRIVLPNGNMRAVNNCKRCSGDGNVEIQNKDKPTYVRCRECKGTGEIKIYNPVIPRGFLAEIKK